MGRLTFQCLESDCIDWISMASCYDHKVTKSREWFDFIYRTKGKIPFVVAMYEDGVQIGYFLGIKFSVLFTIVASPFEGYRTAYQGLSFFRQVSAEYRLGVIRELAGFLFKKRICSFFQIYDFDMDILDEEMLNDFELKKGRGYTLDIHRDYQEVVKGFDYKSARYCINKARKMGVTVSEMTDVETFASRYDQMFKDVFAKQGITPTYGKPEVIALIESLMPDKVLCLEARDTQGTVIGANIYVMDNHFATFWGGASLREYQKLCPNELLMEEGILRLQAKGIETLEFGGGGKYKEKYGPVKYERYKLMKGKWSFIFRSKKMARDLFYGIRDIKTFLYKKMKSK